MFFLNKNVTKYMEKIKPLPVFKQIMTMFCDINNDCVGDDSLRDYILSKKSTTFDKKRYRLYAHIHAGSLERMNGISAQICSDGIVMLTEISLYPVGFTLYIDKPEGHEVLGTEITLFSDYEYDSECNIEMVIPKLESNIIFSGDYRTKEEIMCCRKENQKYKKSFCNT